MLSKKKKKCEEHLAAVGSGGSRRNAALTGNVWEIKLMGKRNKKLKKEICQGTARLKRKTRERAAPLSLVTDLWASEVSRSYFG